MEQRLQWRRDKVRELTVRGLNQRQIASALQVPLTDVNRDLKYLRMQAKANINKYINETLPLEYEQCLIGSPADSDEIVKLNPAFHLL